MKITRHTFAGNEIELVKNFKQSTTSFCLTWSSDLFDTVFGIYLKEREIDRFKTFLLKNYRKFNVFHGVNVNIPGNPVK